MPNGIDLLTIFRLRLPTHIYSLKKGSAFHYDLFVIALLNGFLAMFGFPMMHGVLPHSPLHVRNLSDIEEHVEVGHVHEV